MKNIPTKEEVIGYIKNGRKTIVITVGVFVLLFMVLIAYSIYSTFTETREEEEEFLSQEEIVEILEREPEEVSTADIRNIEEALEEERYAFGVLIEREDQTFYNYPNLITEFLISEEVVSYIEARVGRELLPSAELAVEVSEDSSTRILEVVVGTADVEDNRVIAQAYYDAIQEEGLIVALDDKVIYMMDDEPFLVETETWMDLALAQIQYISPIRAVIGFVVTVIIGFITGVIIVLFKTMLSKEIPFMYELEENDSDTVLYFNQLRGISTEEKQVKLAHSISRFPQKKKIVLSQFELDTVSNLLTEEKKEHQSGNEILFFRDFAECPSDVQFDEVIILIEQNKSTKDWYKNQRIQLSRTTAPVTILNY